MDKHSLLESLGCCAENGKYVVIPFFIAVREDLTSYPDICTLNLQFTYIYFGPSESRVKR